MRESVEWFECVVDTVMNLFFEQKSKFEQIDQIPLPCDMWLESKTGVDAISISERVVVMLALMPHLSPHLLDVFFSLSRDIDRQYTEFGGWKGVSHGGFLPTGETALFMVAGAEVDRRGEVIQLFQPDHWFHTHNILRLEGAGEGEPLLSGQLRLADEFLSRVLLDHDFKPNYSANFPAKVLVTSLEWIDLVVDYRVSEELQQINTWITSHKVIMEEWGLKRILKPGYRSLFYGPPGTGKTLAATLLGKCNKVDVYRVDLSMVLSKYIGETEKNLSKLFDMAENRNWILFFDEADALFSKRTLTNSSNDRHSNQEVAYLLQRIEDFPGIVILATNLRRNIDEAFARRFQSVVYFPMPTQALREKLWLRMLPAGWIDGDGDNLVALAAESELSGGSIINVIRRCALNMINREDPKLLRSNLMESINIEKNKL